MSATQWHSTVVPARLSFLAIYNPFLGPTDETFHDQLVFYYSRAAHEARISAKKAGRNDAAGGDVLREEENEKLRQIGLAQGMVDFARSFSDGKPVDSIETEKSRIVLHELEQGWWILASIDLTRLPSFSQPTPDSSSKGADKAKTQPAFEHSSREVSPPALLLQQLLQVHQIFCLHHGPSLSDLFVRLTRDKFCNTLDRFWTRFSRNWDVLLHGNPAVDVLGGIKLSPGGELGFGVGEEEWGSGEREVLEDLTRRTEGLVDLVVSRFGEPAVVEVNKSTVAEPDDLPWLGSGNQPQAGDGVIFGGVGAIQRHSLRDISVWIRQIYTYGEHAYGVGDNPHRERRKRRRRNPPEDAKHANGSVRKSQAQAQARKVEPLDLRRSLQKVQVDKIEAMEQGQSPETALPEDKRPQIYPRVASHDYTTTPEETPTPPVDPNRPNIPPPIVSAAERALANATKQAERNPEPEQEEADYDEEQSTTLGIPDQYMKYLTFGLSTFGKPAPKKRPPASRQPSTATNAASQSQNDNSKARASKEPQATEDDDIPMMTQLEPMPEGETLQHKIATQKRRENKGHFIIGLKGELDELDDISEGDDGEVTDGSLRQDREGSRIVLRTVQVELVPRAASSGAQSLDDASSRTPSTGALDVGTAALKDYYRLRVLVYIHRPFIYCFLFENRTSALQLTNFYKSLHRNLVPIHKPLLSSTSPAKVTERIEKSHPVPSESDSASVSSATKPSLRPESSPIFDLMYDPRLLALHSSIPNIPEPGTPAAEGISSNSKDALLAPPWTRIEALNVHSQILNTLASVNDRTSEIERTSKTSRGWWVVWMKIPPSAPNTAAAPDDAPGGTSTRDPITDDQSTTPPQRSHIPTPASEMIEKKVMHRIAFLVRKASDASATAKTSSAGSRTVSSMFGNMSLGMTSTGDEKTGGASAGWGPAALAGGIGFDARSYVEGLLSLNR